jgi:transposase
MSHFVDNSFGDWKGTSMRPKGTAAELEQRRRMAISLLEQGMKAAKVAKTVGTSRASVTRWRQAYEADGEQGLAGKPHLGKPAKLTPKQRQRLGRILLGGARKQGYSTDLWTLARVADVIAETFGVEYHPGRVWHVLRAMQWSNQKPERRARERDEAAIATWRAKHWPRIKKRPKRRAKHRLLG